MCFSLSPQGVGGGDRGVILAWDAPCLQSPTSHQNSLLTRTIMPQTSLITFPTIKNLRCLSNATRKSPEPFPGHRRIFRIGPVELLQPWVLSLGPYTEAVRSFFIPGLTVIFLSSRCLLISFLLPGMLSLACLPSAHAFPLNLPELV